MSQEETNITQALFWERFRPTTLEESVLPERIMSLVRNGIHTNMIFTGTCGIGKTTLARILIKNHPHLELSAKLGVDALRDRIDSFCRERVVNFMDEGTESTSQLKIVYFEEFDRASRVLQEELKSFMERYSASTRFLATSNTISSMDENLLSRFSIIDFTAASTEEAKEVRQKYAHRLLKIVTENELPIEKPVLKQILVKHFPDFRSIWNNVQQVVLSGSDTTGISQVVGGQRELYDIVLNPSLSTSQIWDYINANWMDKLDSGFRALGRDFFRHIRDHHESKETRLSEAMDALSEFTDVRLPHAPDPFITLYVLVCRYHKIFR